MSSKEPDARIRIDKMLLEAGWKLPGWAKDEEINVTTEINNNSGEADYVLLSSKENHLCTVEAKKTLLSPLVGKEQARGYAKSLNCRFIILSNGILHYLWDLEQGNPVKIEKFPSQEDLEMNEDVRKMPDGGYGVYADVFKDGKRVMTPGGKHKKELKKVYKNEKDANDYMAAIMIAKGGG